MKSLFSNYKLLEAKPSTTYEWQDRALQVCEALGVPKNKCSVFMKIFKTKREKAEACYKYIIERGNIKTPYKYFLWLINNA